MNKTVVFLSLGAVAVYLLYKKANAANKITFNFTGLKINPIRLLQKPTITLYFRLKNPTDTPLSLTSLTGKIFVNNNFLADLQSRESVIVPEMGSIIFSVNVQVGLLDLLTEITQLLSNRQRVNVLFSGVVQAEGITLPVNQSITL
jgi:LEA14-like dessication related protein